MATRTSLQANHHSASVTSIKQTLTPSSPPPQSNIILPDDFPAHLLLRICDTILQPLLSYNSPLKPHTKPWGRTMNPPTWPVSQKPGGVSNHSIFKPVSTYSSKGVPVTGCKTDLLAWSLCNRRLWQICGERVYRHVKVSSLNVADILVSRRNHLRNTQVLEFYIHRDPEPSQAQTDLNLSRFFIQAGIVILWCPRLELLIIDIRSLPVDRYIWDSFLSRLRQRLFISPKLDLLPSRSAASNDSNRRSLYDSVEIPAPPKSPDNNVSGFGHEQPTMINSSARWGDSQGIISSPERVSVPHLAIALGYNAAGELGAAEDGSATKDDNGGFAKLMDQLLALPTTNPVLPSGLVRGLPPINEFGTLTSIDLLIPRPSWGHEEAEGYALGMILRRLNGLRRLHLHADGGSAATGSSGYNDFGLMRKPPYGHITSGDDSDGESSDIGELDMVVSEHGAVTYPSHNHGYAQNHIGTAHGRTSIPSTSSPRSSGASATGNIIITGGAQEHRHRGYGAETWWAGVLCALSGSDERSKSKSDDDHGAHGNEDSGGDEEQARAQEEEEGGEKTLEKDEKVPPVPPIRELRISVSIPGHVQPQDFDAFYHLILPHLQSFEHLEILIFDMTFSVIPSEGVFSGAYPAMTGAAYSNHAERYTSPGRYSSSPGKHAPPSANERFLWREQENKANWLVDVASAGLGDLKRHLKRQRYYVEQLIDPNAPTSEEFPAEAKRKSVHGHTNPTGQVNQTNPGQGGSIPLRHNHVFRSEEAPILMKRHSEPEEYPTFQSLGLAAGKGIRIRTAPSLRHVYFGDYHGLPSLQPPDVEKSEYGATRVGRVESVFVDVADAANAVSASGPTVSTTASSKSGTGTPGAGMPGTTGGSGAGAGGRGAGVRSASGKDMGGARNPGSSVQENERVVPGMWWTIQRGNTPRYPREKESGEGGEWRSESLVVQGWEELEEDSVYVLQ